MAYRRSWQRDFDRSIREHPDWPVVVSQGDSWFSYPHEKNVIDFLDEPVSGRVAAHGQGQGAVAARLVAAASGAHAGRDPGRDDRRRTRLPERAPAPLRGRRAALLGRWQRSPRPRSRCVAATLSGRHVGRGSVGGEASGAPPAADRGLLPRAHRHGARRRRRPQGPGELLRPARAVVRRGAAPRRPQPWPLAPPGLRGEGLSRRESARARDPAPHSRSLLHPARPHLERSHRPASSASTPAAPSAPNGPTRSTPTPAVQRRSPNASSASSSASGSCRPSRPNPLPSARRAERVEVSGPGAPAASDDRRKPGRAA